LFPFLQHHATGDAYAKDIKPAIAEIEQVRVHCRRDDVFDHDNGPDPGGGATATK
jgi:hypothetical protein